MSRWSAILQQQGHRPYPVPQRAWAMTMSWCDLLFAHWPIDRAVLRELVPQGLELDTFDGRAWVGVVPFRMANTGPRGLNRVPGVSAFAELNVRTYVIRDGRPGVWFFSLDAASRLAVYGARWIFHLPYFHARMRCERTGDEVSYRSERRHRRAPPGAFVGRYRPTGPVYRSQPGTLEHWLTERYCLYSADRRGGIYRAEVHHAPWPLRPAKAQIETCTVTDGWGIHLPDTPPILHFADRLDVLGWWIVRA